ncbi:unnamed protein product [Musa acuminata subsp. malaccensis]|uniref:(wild Malaysian banana) hypothetical protein n=1 Tax=Musa acuminata subsp. malaccensis TaxID=214687 RepID=A0A804HUI1_MUSAM|nr:unnamed protein product [Musa acuminata subsp. malaccensis]
MMISLLNEQEHFSHAFTCVLELRSRSFRNLQFLWFWLKTMGGARWCSFFFSSLVSFCFEPRLLSKNK